MPPIYLSADNPRWTPKTEADLQAGIDQGLLGESHYVDLKAMPDTRGDNKEAARDLVSFAVDGGTLIYGIAEDKVNRTFSLAPQSLKVLADKIQNIVTSSLVDPVLTIVAEEIPSAADTTRGYLVVHIPASPVAPHMADGRYYGRSDKSKYVLSDPQVLRLHERRRFAERDTVALLNAEIANDPIPEDVRKNAHLFLIAQPSAGRRDMLLDLTGGPRWNSNLEGFINQAAIPELNLLLNGMEAQPTIFGASNGYRRARGAARSTPNLGEGRVFQPTQKTTLEDAIEVQVHEDGGLRLLFTRFSDTFPIRPDQQEHMLLEMTAVSSTRRFLALVLAAADKAGYFGNWELGLAATQLRGLRAYYQPGGPTATARYDADTYMETTGVSWAELNQTPGTVTRRLVGPLLRALAAEERYTAVLTDPTPANT